MYIRSLLVAAAAIAMSSPAIASPGHHSHHHRLLKRQSADPMAPLTLVSNPPQNLTAWNEDTNEACMEALGLLDEATNPSGTCVCYNLPGIDTNTGVFEADLRLYKVSEPRDQFVGIAPENIQVGVSYSGASVSQAGSQGQSANPVRRRDGEPLLLSKRAEPQLLQTYVFVGQIDKEQMVDNTMNMATIEALVIPVVTLTGNIRGESVSTNVSMNEAVFVAGVFSDEVVLSDTAQAQLAVDEMMAGLENGTTVFQVPGIRLMIFPIGLIITSIWLAAFISTVGYGTIMRMKYREQFRRRTALAQKGGKGTI